MIDLNYIRLTILIQHHIDPQEMKAHIPILIFRLAKSILMRNQRMTENKGLYYRIMELIFNLFHIVTSFLDEFKDRSQGTLVPYVHSLVAGVVDELWIFLVYCVVS